MFERELRDLAYVPRWAIVRTTRQQNVAEHSFYVTLYADQIAEVIDSKAPRDLVMRYAMYHDLDEILTGDISMPSKQVMKTSTQVGWHLVEKWLDQQTRKRSNMYKKLSDELEQNEHKDEIKAIIKVADLLEACSFLADERFSGNRNVMKVLDHLTEVLYHSVAALPATTDYKKDVLWNLLAKSINESSSTPSKIVTGKEGIK